MIDRESSDAKIAFSFEHRRGHGIGHAVRSLRIIEDLQTNVDVIFQETGTKEEYAREEFIALVGRVPENVRFTETWSSGNHIVVFDKREVSKEEITTLAGSALTVGIDVAGTGRDWISFLIDTLPTSDGLSRANRSGSGYLPLKGPVRDEWPSSPENVLIVFGGEGDGRSERDVVDAILSDNNFCGELSVACGDRSEFELPDVVKRVVARGTLAEELHKFDLVITHFGITAYEALRVRVPVFLVSPTDYHRDLSRKGGFIEGNLSGANGFSSIRSRWEEIIERYRKMRPEGQESIPDVLAELLACPIPARWGSAVERFSNRTYWLEEETGLIRLKRFSEDGVTYGHDYFFEEYRQQYGKTYVEDFDHIVEMGRRRVRSIVPHVGGKANVIGSRLLDIGCAYGPFIAAAKEAGFSPVGIDVNCEATAYTGKRLNVKTYCANILDLKEELRKELGTFRVVTMWYVIEHFEELEKVMETVHDLLESGGVFSFSTPNVDGISGRVSRREFLRKSPGDHYTVWGTKSVERALNHFGFRTCGVAVTGHHPERFSLAGMENWKAMRGLLRSVSYLAKLGDTFEVVAKKV